MHYYNRTCLTFTIYCILIARCICNGCHIIILPSCLPPCGHTTPCRAVPCRAVPCRAVPCRAVPCRAVPCRAVPCRAVTVPGYPKVACQKVECPAPYMGLGVQPGAPPDRTRAKQDPYGAGSRWCWSVLLYRCYAYCCGNLAYRFSFLNCLFQAAFRKWSSECAPGTSLFPTRRRRCACWRMPSSTPLTTKRTASSSGTFGQSLKHDGTFKG
jgi:hypothetical protein